jgi:hypothetical protein
MNVPGRVSHDYVDYIVKYLEVQLADVAVDLEVLNFEFENKCS